MSALVRDKKSRVFSSSRKNNGIFRSSSRVNTGKRFRFCHPEPVEGSDPSPESIARVQGGVARALALAAYSSCFLLVILPMHPPGFMAAEMPIQKCKNTENDCQVGNGEWQAYYRRERCRFPRYKNNCEYVKSRNRDDEGPKPRLSPKFPLREDDIYDYHEGHEGGKHEDELSKVSKGHSNNGADNKARKYDLPACKSTKWVIHKLPPSIAITRIHVGSNTISEHCGWSRNFINAGDDRSKAESRGNCA